MTRRRTTRRTARDRDTYRVGQVIAALAIVAATLGALAIAGCSHKSPTPFPSASLTATPTPTPLPSAEAGDWPTYGYDRARTRFAPNVKLRPPYKVKWKFNAGALLEFPPAIVKSKLYFNNGHGKVFCLDALTGKVIWTHDLGAYLAATPTVAQGKVFVPSMGPHPTTSSTTGGGLYVFAAATGKLLWKIAGIGPTESSPLVWQGRVYFGDRNNTLYAVDIKSHKVVHTYTAGGRFDAAPAELNGRIVIGSYDGTIYCFTRDLRIIWKTHVSRYIVSSDAFYATAALAYNTAYLGSIGNHIYALDLSNGAIRWSFGTGGYVYSSPAVWNGMVFEGSYDGNLYALDARTGKLIWRFGAGNPISGSPTVLNGVVYFSSLGKRTWALDAKTGKVLWTFRDGRYTPVAASEQTVYLTGGHILYALKPKK